jgi:hypothetical protein
MLHRAGAALEANEAPRPKPNPSRNSHPSHNGHPNRNGRAPGCNGRAPNRNGRAPTATDAPGRNRTAGTQKPGQYATQVGYE